MGVPEKSLHVHVSRKAIIGFTKIREEPNRGKRLNHFGNI